MNVQDIWRAKTDDEVLTAVNRLDQYTAETQIIIRGEWHRRSLQPHDSGVTAVVSEREDVVQAESSARHVSIGSARAHLASLAATSTTSRNVPTLSGAAEQRASQSNPVKSSDERASAQLTFSYDYKVVPFIGQSKGSLSAVDVAQQLQSVIGSQASAGWEFCQLSDVNIEVQPGCIAGLFGASAQYVRFDQLIFRKPRH